MRTNLFFVIDCYPLRLKQVREGTCFGHIMVKVANMLQMMKRWLQVWSMFVKVVQNNLQMILTWTKKLGKGR